jgi:hypothetical protein
MTASSPDKMHSFKNTDCERGVPFICGADVGSEVLL